MRTVAILLLCFCSTGFAEETVEIPISEVWSHMSSRYMLTAKRLADLEPEYYRQQGGYLNSRIFQIQQALTAEFPAKSKMKPGFVVIGGGRKALEQAYAVLVKGQTAQDSIPQGSEISVIFFTRMIEYMHLKQIRRTGARITIDYCLEPSGASPIVSAKIAIIPLGKLPTGKYQVDIVGFTKKPADRNSPCELIKDGRMENLVCRPFEFSIVK